MGSRADAAGGGGSAGIDTPGSTDGRAGLRRSSMAVEEKQAASWLGQSIKRKEDDRFLQGRGNYVDDVHLPGMLHMAILRSPLAHARINSIDTSQAAKAPGVVAVVTGADLVA